MAGIQPTSGIQWPTPATGVGAASGPSSSAGASGAAGASADFAQVLQSAFDKVNDQQQNSTMAIQDLITGKTADALPVVEAVAKADMSFKLLMGVRNKVIEAYKQTLNMQV